MHQLNCNQQTYKFKCHAFITDLSNVKTRVTIYNVFELQTPKPDSDLSTRSTKQKEYKQDNTPIERSRHV